MTDTAFVAASFAGQTAGELLSAYTPQTGDVGATFTALGDSSATLLFSGTSTVKVSSGTSPNKGVYAAGPALSSGQNNIDLQADFHVYDLTSATYMELGFTIGDDGTGSNFLQAILYQGSSVPTPGVHLTNTVSGTATDYSDTALTLTPGTTYTMTAQIRGTPGAYTVAILVGPKNGTQATIIPAVSIPGLVLSGRYIGLFDKNYGGATPQADSSGIQFANFYAYNYTASLTAGTVSVTATGVGTATVSTTAATFGTAPYSYQFQRALVTGGTVGSYSNIGTSGTSLTYADTGTVGNTYSYQVVVTDSEGTPATVTSAPVQFAYATPSYSLSTSPTSVSLGQGTSQTVTLTQAGTNGYSQAVSYAISGLPTGVTASVGPASVTGSGTSTLTLTAAGNAVTGTQTLTITGTDTNSLVKTTTMALTVAPPSSGVTLDTVNNNVLALINAVNSSIQRNTFS